MEKLPRITALLHHAPANIDSKFVKESVAESASGTSGEISAVCGQYIWDKPSGTLSINRRYREHAIRILVPVLWRHRRYCRFATNARNFPRASLVYRNPNALWCHSHATPNLRNSGGVFHRPTERVLKAISFTCHRSRTDSHSHCRASWQLCPRARACVFALS